MEAQGKIKATTIKLSQSVKSRIDKLRLYKRETYEEIIENMLDILNLCKVNPESARKRLIELDKKSKKPKLS